MNTIINNSFIEKYKPFILDKNYKYNSRNYSVFFL